MKGNYVMRSKSKKLSKVERERTVAQGCSNAVKVAEVLVEVNFTKAQRALLAGGELKNGKYSVKQYESLARLLRSIEKLYNAGGWYSAIEWLHKTFREIKAVAGMSLQKDYQTKYPDVQKFTVMVSSLLCNGGAASNPPTLKNCVEHNKGEETADDRMARIERKLDLLLKRAKKKGK